MLGVDFDDLEPNDPTLSQEEYRERGLENLRAIDLSPITERVREKGIVENPDEMEKKFKRFALQSLEMDGANENETTKKVAPGQELDEYWHEFILDTKRYTKFCEYVFGKYWHHDPDFEY